MKVTLIGLGKMGSALAARLLLAKFDLTVFNRTKEKMQPIVKAGAKPADSLKDAVMNADVVITSVLDDNAILQTVDGFLTHMRKGAIHVGTSTIMPATSKKLAELHEKQGIVYLAGNVLGVPKVAEKGELTTIVAGDSDAINRCEAIFKSYSANILRVGSHPYQANVFKICANYLLATAIEVFGELYTFAEKSDMDLDIIQKFFHVVFAHPAYKLYIDKVRSRNFDEVNFDLKGGMKDIHLFQQAFASVGVVPDIANILKDKYISALAHNLADKDWSAVTEITRLDANI